MDVKPDIEVVIATCNRAARCRDTVSGLLALEPRFFQRIIVVDSSDDARRSNYPDDPAVLLVPSSHKNQPYQRLLGYLASSARLLLYQDDDMEVSDLGSILASLRRLDQPGVVGVTLGFVNENAFLSGQPRAMSASLQGRGMSALRTLTGAPRVKPNELWFCGLRGTLRSGSGVQFVQGGAFAASRTALYEGFNFVLFDIYEARVGKGEDAMIGHTLATRGEIWCEEANVFLHVDQEDSTYTSDLRSFNRRVAFSRLYLSLEYARLNGFTSLRAHMHYHWYMLWRSTSMLASLCLRPSRARRDSLQGCLAGWGRAAVWRPRAMEEAEQYWREEGRRDLTRSLP